MPGIARFRVNVYFQRDCLAAAFRLVPRMIKSANELGLPEVLRELAMQPRGLVLITGPTGSGKSTTLATMIDEINSTRSHHIVTIEDPIEFLHQHKESVINQREIGSDAKGFAEALRGALRQDPDVILVGEMRDLETISTALTAAETGHLVLATLHTQSAPSTIDRIIDVFPSAQQGQVRMQVAAGLQGIVTQTLLPRRTAARRVPALEILLPDDAVRNLIRQGKTEQIYSIMQTNTGRGMQTMEQSLADLVLRRVISQETAFNVTSRREEFESLLARSGVKPQYGRTPSRGPPRPPNRRSRTVSGITDFLKKDISFGRKASTTVEAKSEAKTETKAEAPKQEATPKTEAAKTPKAEKTPKAARKPRKTPSTNGNGGGGGGSRHKQVVGLSVGASQLAAAVIVNNGHPKLVKAARHTLPPDVVVGGEVRDAEALANEISTFFHDQDLPRKNVRLGIGSSRTGVRVFERPTVDDPRQLANAIRFRAYETLPIPIEEAMLDYHIVEETTTPDRVLLAVAYRDLVDRFAATCIAAKIDLVGIDIEAFALLRAVGGEPLTAGQRAEAARVAVSIGHDRTTVAVSDGRLCEFTRVLDWGGSRVTAAIGRALEIDPAEAEPSSGRSTSRAHATDELDGRADDEGGRGCAPRGHRPRPRARLLPPLLPGSTGFAGLRRDHDHRRRRPPSGARRAARRADRHQRPCGRPVRTRRFRSRHQLQRPGRRPRRRNRTGNRGLMRAVNLLPRQSVQQKREGPNAVVLVAAIGGAAVLLALVGGFLLANRSVDRQRQDLSAARAVLANTPAHHLSAKTSAFRSAVLTQREQRSLALASAIGKRVAWDRILRRFSLVLPDDVWLTDLTGTCRSTRRSRPAQYRPRRAHCRPRRPRSRSRATRTARRASHVCSSGSRCSLTSRTCSSRTASPRFSEARPSSTSPSSRTSAKEGVPRDRPPLEPLQGRTGRARRDRPPPGRRSRLVRCDLAQALHRF